MTNNSYFNFISDMSDENVELALEALRQELEARKGAKAHEKTKAAAPANTSGKNDDGKNDGGVKGPDPKIDNKELPKHDDFEDQIRNVFVAAVKQMALAKKVSVKGNVDAKKVSNSWDNGRSMKVNVGFDISIEIG